MSKTTVNLPPSLLKALEQRATQTGVDATSVVVQALLELFAGQGIGNTALADSLRNFQNGATCAACGLTEVSNFIILMDEPLITVCAPFCPSTSGPVDAHGYNLHPGDQVVCCLTPDGAIQGRVVGLSVDTHSDPVATIAIEDTRRTYRMRCRMLTRVDRKAGKARASAAQRPAVKP